MSFPNINFIYNTTLNDVPYAYSGGPDTNFTVISGSNLSSYKLIFTGGGILGTLPTPTCASGTRDATIKPTLQSYVIPQTYVEDSTTMYNVPMAGFGGALYQPYRYVFGLYVDGETTSDIYIEAWDDFSFSTYNMEVLQGTTNNGFNSMINAIRTTLATPPWHPKWSGSDDGAAYLRGDVERVALSNSSSVSNEALYFNIYIELPTDCTTFHNTPAISFRYLYS